MCLYYLAWAPWLHNNRANKQKESHEEETNNGGPVEAGMLLVSLVQWPLGLDRTCKSRISCKLRVLIVFL